MQKKQQQDQSQIKWISDFIWNIADDRLRDGSGTLTGGDAGAPAILATVDNRNTAGVGATCPPSGGNPANFDDPGIRGENKFGVIVMCGDAGQQESVYNDLTGMGYNCKIVVV